MASSLLGKLSGWVNQKTRWTREGLVYALVLFGLGLAGLKLQVNLIFLVLGLAVGPLFTSLFLSASTLKRVKIARRLPGYIFAGEPLHLDYVLENDRPYTAALALTVEDAIVPVDRTIPGAAGQTPRVFFPRVAGQDKARLRWQGASLKRGKYEFRSMELITRSPFGLLERRVTLGDPASLVVYPQIGQLTRRWHVIQRESTETRRGSRHDRSAQQQEYHGLRDYRPGDSPRWIHWRTSARLGEPMVKEFEQQHEQDLAILIDPWLPRTKVATEQREAMEEAIRFVATLCLETCRHQGRRLTLGWTGATPGVRQGPASVRLLHELLEQLAVMRPASEGSLAALLDALPPATLREAILIVVSTRPLNLIEEAEKSARLAGASARGVMGRIVMLDAARGDLAGLIQYGDAARTLEVGTRWSTARELSGARRGDDGPAEGRRPAAAATAARAGLAPGANGRNGKPHDSTPTAPAASTEARP